jgi:hypothetical protein
MSLATRKHRQMKTQIAAAIISNEIEILMLDGELLPLKEYEHRLETDVPIASKPIITHTQGCRTISLAKPIAKPAIKRIAKRTDRHFSRASLRRFLMGDPDADIYAVNTLLRCAL